MTGWRWPAAVATVLAMAVCPAARAAAPGDDGSLVYQSDDPSASLGVVTPDGALARSLPVVGGAPVWTPDGTRITFGAQDPSAHSDLFTMAPDGTDVTELLAGGDLAFPAWSPDGTKVAFGSFDGNWDIWVANADGSDARNLTSNPAEDIWPSWSADSRQIAFQSNRDGDREIYAINSDGSGLHDVTNRHASEDQLPDWSPTGHRIAFDGTSATGRDIFVVNGDGTGLEQLTHGAAAESASWSPEGDQLAYLNTNSRQIYVVNADGTDPTQVTHSAHELFRPEWQPLSPAHESQTEVDATDPILIYGEDTDFTATVTGAGGATPTGPVRFLLNGAPDGPLATLDAAGQASYSSTYLLDVGDVVSATYGGDARWGWSTGDATLDVEPARTAVTLQTTPNPVAASGVVTAHVTVRNLDTDIAPFGSVRFRVNGADVGDPVALDANGTTTVQLKAASAPGNYGLTAAYRDDTADIPDFVASSATVTEQVNAPAATATPSPTATPAPTPTPAPVPAARTVRRADLMATIGALARGLRTRGLAALRGAAVRFAAATAGTLRIQVRTGQVLLASGQHAFASSGSARVPLRLTRAAKRAIRRAHAAAVEIRASFTPAHGPVVAASTRVRAARRRPTHTIAMR